MTTDHFRDSFLSAATTVAATTAGAAQGADYVDRVQEAIDHAEDAIVSTADNATHAAFAKGSVAEDFHTGSYNIDAVRQGLPPEAKTPRETTDHGPDIVFGEDRLDPTQLKYYSSPEASASAVSDAGYAGQSRLLPADQIDQARAWLLDRAAATSETDPEASARYMDAARSLTDRLEHVGAQSTPLTVDEARSLVDDARDDGMLDLEELGWTPREVIELSDQMRESLGSGLDAAEIAVGIQIAGLVVDALQRAIEEGSLTSDDIEELAQGRPGIVAKSAFTGTVAGALATAADSGALGDAAEALAPEAISLFVVLTINSAVASYRAATGQISWTEAGYRMAKGGAAVAGGAAGAAIGTVALPGVGFLIGSIVGAALARTVSSQGERLAMALAVSNGWTYFGVVEQDHRIPERTLKLMGWETVDLQAPDLQNVALQRVEIQSVDLQRAEVQETVHLLRRGVIGVRRIGYV